MAVSKRSNRKIRAARKKEAKVRKPGSVTRHDRKLDAAKRKRRKASQTGPKKKPQIKAENPVYADQRYAAKVQKHRAAKAKAKAASKGRAKSSAPRKSKK